MKLQSKGDDTIDSLSILSEENLDESNLDNSVIEKQIKEIEKLWNGTEAFEIHISIKDNSMKVEMTLYIKNASDKMLKDLLPQFDFNNEYFEIRKMIPKEVLDYYKSLNYTCE